MVGGKKRVLRFILFVSCCMSGGVNIKQFAYKLLCALGIPRETTQDDNDDGDGLL